MSTWRRALALPLAVGLLAIAVSASGASRYDPRLRFRVLATAHFRIYFHRGEEALALRLQTIAERVHGRLTARLHTIPRGITHVVLVDQDDRANGSATPYPYDTIELTATAPTPGEIIGNYDDWLTLVFTHEYTHVLHLDRSEGWSNVARHILGRSPLALPNLYLPLWQVEGLATFEESVNTGRGRLPAGDFREIVDAAARSGRPEPMDRVNGGLIAWPAGSAHYAYGAYFHQYLADRFGEDKLADLAEATARRFPYTGSKAFQYVFGESLGELWKAFEQSRVDAARAPVPDETPRHRLTHRGFLVRGPRFLPTAPGETAALVFSATDQDDFPALYSIDLDSRRERRLATRVGGDRIGVGSDALYFDQLEVARNVTVQGDLYTLDRRTGHVRRLTRGLRIADVDLSPDGRSLAVIVHHGEGRGLVVIDPNSVSQAAMLRTWRNLASSPQTQYASPRWSPDGRTIAVERLVLGGPSEIVLVDARSGAQRPLVRWADSRNVSPAWMPDGRTLLFASARGGLPFDVYAIDIDSAPPSIRRVTRTAAGATFPDVARDGRTLAYVGYTPDGYDVFTMPIDPAQWTTIDAPGDGPVATAPLSTEHSVVPDAHGYAPFSTLVPRSWFPILEGDGFQTRVGAQTGGVDVLGRHAFSAAASWWVAGERRPELQSQTRPNWGAAYTYDRWRPAFFAAASEADTLYPLARVSQGRTTELLERHASGGVVLSFAHMRWVQTTLAAVNYERDTTISGLRRREFERSAYRLGWVFSNAKNYGYSISGEQGVTLAATSEHVRRAIGADGNADALTFDARAYVRAGPRHAVAAVRAAAGVSDGDSNVRREFDLGGSASRFAFFDYGRDALSILRGFDSGTFAGRRLWNVNLEYRAPVWRVERGFGTWPIFFQTVHAAAFADAGNAWTGRLVWRDTKSSIGGEVAVDVVGGYFLPFTLAAGAALGRDGLDGRTQTRFYVRAGRSF